MNEAMNFSVVRDADRVTSQGIYSRVCRYGIYAAGLLTLVIAAGCTVAPSTPDGAQDVRNKLTQLQSDPSLANRVPRTQEEAQAAVRLAEQPVAEKDKALGAHRVFMADRQVEIATARATTSALEAQREELVRASTTVRLDARTSEADSARSDAAEARGAKQDMQREIERLKAEKTDRGLVLTLGDVLFATGKAELKVGAENNLNNLVSFLGKYQDRSVEVEGHTDNVGAEAYNQALSEQRAESVKAYLVSRGIAGQRITTVGKGMHSPKVDNGSASGRQQNRRVEVIILEPQSG